MSIHTKVNCFLCDADITRKTKVISYFNYPDKLWDGEKNHWSPKFKELFNKAMCQKCAKKDLATAHKIANLKSEISGLEKELKKQEQRKCPFNNKRNKKV